MGGGRPGRVRIDSRVRSGLVLLFFFWWSRVWRVRGDLSGGLSNCWKLVVVVFLFGLVRGLVRGVLNGGVEFSTVFHLIEIAWRNSSLYTFNSFEC